jgi:hypothetical protein
MIGPNNSWSFKTIAKVVLFGIVVLVAVMIANAVGLIG